MEIEVISGMLEILKNKHPKLVVEIHRGVNREEFLDIIKQAGYSSNAIPIEPVNGEKNPLFIDNHSYLFY